MGCGCKNNGKTTQVTKHTSTSMTRSVNSVRKSRERKQIIIKRPLR